MARVPALIVAITAVLSNTTNVLPAGQAPDLERLLASPPAPGVEALFVSHPRDPRVPLRWRSLLSHGDAKVRLAAARMLGVTDIKDAAPDLLAALTEPDVDVLAEILQALAIVAPDESVAQIYPHLARIGVWRSTRLLDGLAATRPGLVGEHLMSGDVLRAHTEWVGAVYGRLARSAPALVDAIDAELGTRDEKFIRGILLGAREARRRISPAVSGAWIARSDFAGPQLLEYLAAMYRWPGTAADRATLAARLPAAPPATAPPVERWRDELKRRLLGRERSVNLDPVIGELPDQWKWTTALPGTVLEFLSEPERRAFVRRFDIGEPRRSQLIQGRAGDPPIETRVAGAVLSDVPGVILADLLRVAGCQPKGREERVLAVRYRADRRAAEVRQSAESWSPGCERAALAAVAIGYGPPLAGTDEQLVLLRLDNEFVKCLTDRRDSEMPVDEPDSAKTREPRKTSDRRPEYPQEALTRRLEGVVQLEGIVSKTGCVAELRIVGSVHPVLDLAALRAASRWRYEPAALDGVPTEVVMTVFVNFSMR